MGRAGEETAVLTRSYDPDGRLALETATGGMAYTIRYQRDSEGREISRRRTGEAGVEEWSYTYGSDDQVLTETYRARGVIQRVRTYTGDREWYDDLHRNGRPVLRIFYQDEQRVGEEAL